MAVKKEKDFNAMLLGSKDMPVVKEVDDPRYVRRYGGTKMLIAPPIEYDELMRLVPEGKVVTAERIRAFLAERHSADYTCPMTAGIFINIAAQASEQRDSDPTPYWRTLRKDGELNEKYPGGAERQKQLLEAEGHTVTAKGKRMLVADYQETMFDLQEGGPRP